MPKCCLLSINIIALLPSLLTADKLLIMGNNMTADNGVVAGFALDCHSEQQLNVLTLHEPHHKTIFQRETHHIKEAQCSFSRCCD